MQVEQSCSEAAAQTSLTVQIIDLFSSQNSRKDPDRVDITVNAGLHQKCVRCVDLTQAYGLRSITLRDGFGFSFFELVETGSTAKDGIGEFRWRYAPIEPEYQLDHEPYIETFDDGEIKVTWPFKHSNDKLWCYLGPVEDLLKLPGQRPG